MHCRKEKGSKMLCWSPESRSFTWELRLSKAAGRGWSKLAKYFFPFLFALPVPASLVSGKWWKTKDAGDQPSKMCPFIFPQCIYASFPFPQCLIAEINNMPYSFVLYITLMTMYLFLENYAFCNESTEISLVYLILYIY